MNSIKFIHFGDLHLDASFLSSGFSEVEAKLRRQELKDVFARVIDEVISRKAQLLLISGDFFEHEYVSKSTIDFIIRQINRILDVRVFISPGNHDPVVGNSYYSLIDWPQNVHIFRKGFECVELKDLNAVVCGAGFTAKTQYETMIPSSEGMPRNINKFFNFSSENIDQAQNREASNIKLLVMHGTVDGDVSNCPYNPISSKEIAKLGFDYCALGHYHKRIEYLSGRAINPGSPEPLGFDEPGQHGIIFGQIAAVTEAGEKAQTEKGQIDYCRTLETEFIKMNSRQYINCEINISTEIESINNIDDLESLISRKLESNQNNFVNVVITGLREFNFTIDIELLRERFSGACRYLKITDNTSFNTSMQEVVDSNNIRGIFTRLVLGKIEEANDEEQKKLLYKALKLGLEALEN